ncbi:helix-turn-helix transcriptional regulator [Kitasatospora sp. MAP5-34]|uniref:helix-turn-helix domain-containing protein n=1 Tax=Kitasatospora sp. MAP5-34 TaxID=3035102 RepID=UPI002476E5A3|nr:helix-turn-helix transcriptional regulator [Kitasatospora sp. MAP5-34]MDH6577257.1 hypothetical protein [Kitasatospora sp. MAP5-34]
MSTTEQGGPVAGQRQSAVTDFAAALRQLRLEAGKPSFRAMAGATGAISHTTLHEAASGSRLPSWPTTRSYVRACGGHEAEWRRRWLAAASAASGRETADHRPPEPEAALPHPQEPDEGLPPDAGLPASATDDGTPPEPPQDASAQPHRFRRHRRVLTHLVALAAGTALGAGTVLATDRVTVTVTVPAAAVPSYVARVASATGTTYQTATTLPVQHAVAAGETLVVPVMLTNTRPGEVRATDSQGNTYMIAADQTDGAAGDRTLVLTATVAGALSPSDTITLSYPSTGEQHVIVDELTDVRVVDQHAAATGARGTDFNSGTTPTTRVGPKLVFGVAGVQGGAPVTWTDGFTALPTLSVSADQLATGYKRVTVASSYAAVGTCDHQWMAGVVAFA